MCSQRQLSSYFKCFSPCPAKILSCLKKANTTILFVKRFCVPFRPCQHQKTEAVITKRKVIGRVDPRYIHFKSIHFRSKYFMLFEIPLKVGMHETQILSTLPDLYASKMTPVCMLLSCSVIGREA